jgi:hypothetical protein
MPGTDSSDPRIPVPDRSAPRVPGPSPSDPRMPGPDSSDPRIPVPNASMLPVPVSGPRPSHADGAGPDPRDEPRRRGSRRRWVRRIGNGVAALAIVALAVYLDTAVLTPDDLAAPLTSAAALGEVAETGRFSARLEQVEFARALDLKSTRTDAATGQEVVAKSIRVTTEHVFVIATVSATVPKQPTKFDTPGLQTRDEIFYAQTDRVEKRFTLSNAFVQPGFWAKGVFVFEVPPEALAGSKIVLSVPSTNGIYDLIYPNRYNQLLPEVALDLGLTEAKAKSAVADAKDVHELKAVE